MQHWEKFSKKLKKVTKNKFPKHVMCKEKWNSLNFNFKKLIDYHSGIGNHTSL